MTQWEVKNGQLIIAWKDIDDMKNFIDSVMKPVADRFGYEIVVQKKKEAKDSLFIKV